MPEHYDLKTHAHRFAAWAAATGASASPKCRFTVAQGKAILEEAGFTADFHRPSQLPAQTQIDQTHAKWRDRVIKAAAQRRLKFSHGIAAKLINLYLKSRFTLAGHASHPRVAALHPPIDSLLLKAINQRLSPAQRFQTAWSTFDSKAYQQTINRLRTFNQAAPFWAVETHWQGHAH